MDLNNMGTGKKLIALLVKAGNIKRMGWSASQQKNARDEQKNPHPPTSPPR